MRYRTSTPHGDKLHPVDSVALHALACSHCGAKRREWCTSTGVVKGYARHLHKARTAPVWRTFQMGVKVGEARANRLRRLQETQP